MHGDSRGKFNFSTQTVTQECDTNDQYSLDNTV